MRIASGVYQPDRYIPSERNLAKEFSTSRSTIAAAVDLLCEKGLLTQAAGRGTRVLPPRHRLGRKAIGVVHRAVQPGTGLPGPEGIRMLEGIQEVLTRLQYRYELYAGRKGLLAADLLEERFAAVLFVETQGANDIILELERRKVPVVVANLEVELDVSATWVDHREIAESATKLLAAMGHSRIGLLSCDPKTYFYGRTLEGYRAGLQEAGLEEDPGLIAISEKGDPLTAYFACRSLLAASPPPTAIFAARDRLAHGAWRAATEAGLVVGRDISLIGFDDLTWPEKEPFLTTYREPCHELGAVAAEMLVERIVSGWRPPEKRKLEAPLIMRRTAAPRLSGEAVLAERGKG